MQSDRTGRHKRVQPAFHLSVCLVWEDYYQPGRIIKVGKRRSTAANSGIYRSLGRYAVVLTVPGEASNRVVIISRSIMTGLIFLTLEHKTG